MDLNARRLMVWLHVQFLQGRPAEGYNNCTCNHSLKVELFSGLPKLGAQSFLVNGGTEIEQSKTVLTVQVREVICRLSIDVTTHPHLQLSPNSNNVVFEAKAKLWQIQQ